ncbi:hypothetical protein BGW36DRAFT_364162 [Talaromyces proteolyticus]|uniref:Uncharacterized protein n=1 Tax=Talaromyces proteolyticus TaxID=1131652 RepID=A0AAD4PVD3_9EURO|nr:uncharacterized protein BGW36DRAFT_364162 [Talaromyces proteolyticus]KAH8690593.1 hypothetical protein BGW36DRAFT_364162 [Talaromyces proteolyticus]
MSAPSPISNEAVSMPTGLGRYLKLIWQPRSKKTDNDNEKPGNEPSDVPQPSSDETPSSKENPVLKSQPRVNFSGSTPGTSNETPLQPEPTRDPLRLRQCKKSDIIMPRQ